MRRAGRRTAPAIEWPACTIGETLRGYDVNQWYGIIAPAGTPRDVLERLQKEIARAIVNPKVVEQFTNLDTER